jgi:hypothetical protein
MSADCQKCRSCNVNTRISAKRTSPFTKKAKVKIPQSTILVGRLRSIRDSNKSKTKWLLLRMPFDSMRLKRTLILLHDSAKNPYECTKVRALASRCALGEGLGNGAMQTDRRSGAPAWSADR